MTEQQSSVPTSVKDLIARWDKIADFARETGFSYESCRAMSMRNTVTPKHWDKIIKVCRDKGVPGVDYEWFVRLQAKPETV